MCDSNIPILASECGFYCAFTRLATATKAETVGLTTPEWESVWKYATRGS